MVPDGGERANAEVVIQAVCLPGVLENAVRKSGRQNGREIPVARGIVSSQRGAERKILLPIIADGIDAVGRWLQKSIHLAAIIFEPRTRVTMVRIVIITPGEIRSKREGGVRISIVIQVAEPGLPAVGIRQPAEKMIEAAVLHHGYHHVLDLAGPRLRAKELSGRHGGAGCL